MEETCKKRTLVIESEKEFTKSVQAKHTNDTDSKFDSLLLQGWRTAMENDVFNYKIIDLEFKVLAGQYGIVTCVSFYK